MNCQYCEGKGGEYTDERWRDCPACAGTGRFREYDIEFENMGKELVDLVDVICKDYKTRNDK